VELRPQMLRGFARGIFRIGDVVERALENLSPSGIDMIIYNIYLPGQEDSISTTMLPESIAVMPVPAILQLKRGTVTGILFSL
jgi:hypothetical protein